MSTNTSVDTETETKTGTLTRSKGACAMGAGALAITCKTTVLGFFVAGLGLAGLSSFGVLALMTGVVVLASAFMWKGLRWAGRRPALLGVSGVVTMFVGYLAAGYFVSAEAAGGSREFLGAASFGMMRAGDILANPVALIPVALLYIAGTGLIFAGVYDSYIRELDVFDSTGGMAAGIAGVSICGGCGLTGMAGAGMVLLTGASATNATKFLGADALMVVAVVGILAYTIYQQAWIPTLVAAVGAVLGFFLTGGLFGFPASGGVLGMVGITLTGNIGEVVGTALTWFGLGLLFLGLIWAAYPDLEILPPDWKERLTGGDRSGTAS